jgi:hypothetical protein
MGAKGISMTTRVFCVALGLVASLLANCGDDEKRKADREREEKGRAERLAKSKAEREAEAALMADPVAAARELESRISAWLTIQDGLIIVRGNTTTWSWGQPAGKGRWPLQVMPATTPWFVRCDDGVLEVILGGWYEQGEPMFNAELTRTKLSDDQCKTLAAVVGRKMLSLTRGS